MKITDADEKAVKLVVGVSKCPLKLRKTQVGQ